MRILYNIKKGVNSWHCFINYYKTGQKYIKLNDMWSISVKISQQWNTKICVKAYLKFTFFEHIWCITHYAHIIYCAFIRNLRWNKISYVILANKTQYEIQQPTGYSASKLYPIIRLKNEAGVSSFFEYAHKTNGY